MFMKQRHSSAHQDSKPAHGQTERLQLQHRHRIIVIIIIIARSYKKKQPNMNNMLCPCLILDVSTSTSVEYTQLTATSWHFTDANSHIENTYHQDKSRPTWVKLVK